MNIQSVGYRAKAFEARNLAFFFLLSLGFPLIVGLLTYTGLLHTPQGLSDPVLIPWILLNIPILLGPSTAAFVVAGLTEGKPGVKELWGRFWNRNVSLKWLLVAVLILPLLRLIAAVLTQILSDTSYPFFVEGGVLDVLIIPLGMGLFSGIHEEFGWRGYALPRFQAKWNALASCIMLGAITALWHLPGFITPGEPLFGRSFWEWLPWHMLIQIVGFSWIFNNTKGNVLAVILFHATTSLSLFVVDFTYYWVLLVAAILIVMIFGAKDLVMEKAGEGSSTGAHRFLVKEMSTRARKTMTFISTISGGVSLLLLLGYLFFPRPDLPAPVTEDICTCNNIHLDGNSIQTIYHAPESILADPQAFLQSDPAYRMLGEHRARVSDPFPLAAWMRDIQSLADQPVAKREFQAPYRLYQLIMANQASFCQEVVTAILPYLPDGAASNVTIYLTALEGSAPAFAADGEIAFSLSHPLFSSAQRIHEPTGLSAFYNLGLHELFHIYFGSVYPWPTLEEHMENEVVMDMLMALHNEGIATHISHQLNARYPSPFEWFHYLLDQKPVVRLYIDEMNELFAIAQTRPTGEAYDAIYRDIASLCYQKKGYNILGAYMAMTIENELGREALAQTVSGGYEAFVRAYNTVADEEMQIQWSTAP